MIEKKYYKRRDISELLGLPKERITNWENRIGNIFHFKKDRNGVKIYNEKGVELFKRLFHLLYVDLYTLEGAKRVLLSKNELSLIGIDQRELLIKYEAWRSTQNVLWDEDEDNVDEFLDQQSLID